MNVGTGITTFRQSDTLHCHDVWQHDKLVSQNIKEKEKSLWFTRFSQRKLSPLFYFCGRDKLSFYTFSGDGRVSKHVYDARERDVGWEESKSLMTWFPNR